MADLEKHNLRKSSPYLGLPSSAFWKNSVSGKSPEEFKDLHTPKFSIKKNHKIATAGSCFAQHLSRHLKTHGVLVMDTEPLPVFVSDKLARAYGYKTYSGRFGNIYYVRQLLQLIRECQGKFHPENPVWERGGRFFDALRPNVEPLGLGSHIEVLQLREYHLRHVHSIFSECDIFIFTLGLTEGWVHKYSGTVYPTAPGTIAGEYDPNVYEFKNFNYREIFDDLISFRQELLSLNAKAKILLTVSPVPLAATASGLHVLPATIYSKSVLRAVTGDFVKECDNVDYFPSYEIITSSSARGSYFDETFRGVEEKGVDTVMQHFFSSYPSLSENILQASPKPLSSLATSMEAICEDILLDAFGEAK